MTLNDLINRLSEAKAIKKQLEAELKTVEKSIGDIEKLIMNAMDEDKILEAKSENGKVSLSESVYPHVERWDMFGDFILDNRYLHLLEKRPAVLAYRELLTLGRTVPGVLPFTKRKLSFKD